MSLEELRTMPLNKLVESLYLITDSKMLNLVIYEIVCRIYVPFKDKSFDELLLEFGYTPIQQQNIDKKNLK